MSRVGFTAGEVLKAFVESGARTMRTPGPCELFIDIDCDADYQHFARALELLNSCIGAAVTSDAPSRSGLPHRHIVVTLSRAVRSVDERLALQAALGSDRMHELLSCLALGAGLTEPTYLFDD